MTCLDDDWYFDPLPLSELDRQVAEIIRDLEILAAIAFLLPTKNDQIQPFVGFEAIEPPKETKMTIVEPTAGRFLETV